MNVAIIVLLIAVAATARPAAQPAGRDARPSAPSQPTSPADKPSGPSLSSNQPSDADIRVLQQQIQDVERFASAALDASKTATDRLTTVSTLVLTVPSVLFVVLLAVAGLGLWNLKQDIKESLDRADKVMNKYDAAFNDLRRSLEADAAQVTQELRSQLDAVRKTNNDQEAQLRELERKTHGMKPFADIREEFERELEQEFRKLQSQYMSPDALKRWMLIKMLQLQSRSPDDTRTMLTDELQSIEAAAGAQSTVEDPNQT